MHIDRVHGSLRGVLIRVVCVAALCCLVAGAPVASQEAGSWLAGSPIIVDHTCTDLGQIPPAWITAAKSQVAWVYGHTSHGSQLISGAEYLSSYVSPPVYRLIQDYYHIPAQSTPPGLRVGDDSGWGWNPDEYVREAREHLNAVTPAPGQITVFMWSWCGEQSWNSVAQVQGYLNMMNQLEGEYPHVRFVYMTGHTDEWSADTLKRNNDLVRDYVRDNGKILYDFADIESYLPNGVPYPEPDDSCPWCQSWCNSYPGDCPQPAIEDCAHSHSLNCLLKGKAFWWLSARLAGWDGNGSELPLRSWLPLILKGN
jgi:hypothetical protein